MSAAEIKAQHSWTGALKSARMTGFRNAAMARERQLWGGLLTDRFRRNFLQC